MSDKNVEKTYRISLVRKRTWLVTLIILVTLVLYFLVYVGFGDSFNLVDFIFTCFITLTIYYTYFPDGELYGATDSTFLQNKNAYNLLAGEINKKRQVHILREYCKVEYKKRCDIYLDNQLGSIGLDKEQYEWCQKLSKKDFKALESIEVNGKLVMLSRGKKRALARLLYCKLPVEPNFPETILSAVENNGSKSIRDTSKSYKTKEYVLKAIKSIIIGGFLAYIGYTLKDGITLADIVKICVYITNMIINAVMSYSGGEICIKDYKNKFYIDLSIFIDGFNEYVEKGY